MTIIGLVALETLILAPPGSASFSCASASEHIVISYQSSSPSVARELSESDREEIVKARRLIEGSATAMANPNSAAREPVRASTCWS